MGKLYDSLLSDSSSNISRGTEVFRKRPRRRASEPTAKQILVQQRKNASYDFFNTYKESAKNYPDAADLQSVTINLYPIKTTSTSLSKPAQLRAELKQQSSAFVAAFSLTGF